jgi:hypothetical protein
MHTVRLSTRARANHQTPSPLEAPKTVGPARSAKNLQERPAGSRFEPGTVKNAGAGPLSRERHALITTQDQRCGQ